MIGTGWKCDQCGKVEVEEGPHGPAGWLDVGSVGDGSIERPVVGAHLCSEECVLTWAQARINGDEVAA